MNFSYKKLLPSVMQNTRWGELIEAVQSILDDVRRDKVDILKTQFDIEQMSDEELIYLALKFGKVIPNYDGYTDTSFYLKRQMLSLIPRILNRNTEKGYKYTGYVYALRSNIYPIYQSKIEKFYGWSTIPTTLYFQTPILHPDTEWTSFVEETTEGLQYLNNNFINYDSVYIDSSGVVHYVVGSGPAPGDPLYLGTPQFSSLDSESISNSYTRHLVYSYQPFFIENETEFLSDNTCRALYLDILSNKRRTEVVYFEPTLTIPIDYSGTITKTQYTSYDNVYSGNVMSAYYNANSGIPTYIQIGNGTFSETSLQSGILSVQNLIASFTIGVDVLDTVTTNNSGIVWFQYRKIPVQKYKFQTYSEVAILNESSGVMMYATFPDITYYRQMYSNFNFIFQMNNIGSL